MKKIVLVLLFGFFASNSSLAGSDPDRYQCPEGKELFFKKFVKLIGNQEMAELKKKKICYESIEALVEFYRDQCVEDQAMCEVKSVIIYWAGGECYVGRQMTSEEGKEIPACP